jgi:amino acid transporter
MSQTETKGLKTGALGMVGLSILGAAMMCPAIGIYLNWGPMASLVGLATPLVFLAALVIALPSAISYSQLSSRMTSSGAVYAWSWRILSPKIGVWTGIIMTFFYVVATILQPILFGMFFNDLLSLLGVEAPGMLTWGIGAALITLVVMYATYNGISISIKTALVFIAIELVVVFALLLTILFTGATHGIGLTLSPYNPANIQGGANAFWSAMIFGILSFAGFDVIQTAAEETKTPTKIIPKATILVVVIVGLFWAVGSWIFSISEPLDKVQDLMASGFTPATAIAEDYWGAGKILVDLTSMTALGGALVACAVGASRVLFAQGRQGTLPSFMGEVHPTKQVPTKALHVVWAATILGTGIVTMWLGNANSAFVWWAGSIAFFALLTYFFVHMSSMVYFWKKKEFNWFIHGVIPVVGMALVLYLINRTFLTALWALDWKGGKSIVVFGFIPCVAGLIYVLMPSKKLKAVLAGPAPEVEEA